MPTKSLFRVVDIDVTTSKTDQVIAEIVARQERGEHVDQDRWIADHPEIADSLASFFANADLFQKALGMGAPGRAMGEHPDPTRQMAAETEMRGSPGMPREFSSGERDFGRYRIIRLLGEGGMGAVYLARDLVLKRDVAIKVPKFSSAEKAQQVERFRREAMASAKLRHRNICPVFDVGRFEGVDYMTMAFIEGRPLSKVVASRQRLDQSKTAATVFKLAQGIQHAHSFDVVHRDLKPSNVMIDAHGDPVLMDFGLAKQINLPEQSGLTESGFLLGTPAYMSPEQIRGIQGDIGPQSDIYSLGVILFQMLTGRLPYDGGPLEVMGKKLVDDVYRPRQFRPDVDDGLEQICLRMMVDDRSRRYQTMGEVTKDLRAAALRLRVEGPRQRPDATSDRPVSCESDTAIGKKTGTMVEPRSTRPIAPPTPPTASWPMAPPLVDDTSASVSPSPTQSPASHASPAEWLLRRVGRWQIPIAVSIAILIWGLVYTIFSLTRDAEPRFAADRKETVEPAYSTLAEDMLAEESTQSTEQLVEIPPTTGEDANAEIDRFDFFDARMQQVFHSMAIQNVRTANAPLETRDQVVISFDLVNRSGKSITIPVNEPSVDHQVPLGTGTIWVERQGAVGKIPWPDDRHPVDFWYPVGTWDTRSNALVSASETLHRRCEISTDGFPNGRYNVHVQYADFQLNALSVASGTFVLANRETTVVPVFDQPEPDPIEIEPEAFEGGDTVPGEIPRANQFIEGLIGDVVGGKRRPAPKLPPKRIRPWEAVPPESRGFSVVPNMQSLSDKLDHLAGVIGYPPPHVLANATRAARFDAGLDPTGPLLCLYGPPSRTTHESPLVFMIPTTDFNRLIRNLNPRGSGRMKFVTDGMHKFKCLKGENHACFSLIGEYGWLQRCCVEPGGRADMLTGLNPFLDRLDIAFALSKRAATEGLAIQLPFSSGSYVIPEWMNDYAESVFTFSGFDVAAGGTEIIPGVGVSVAVAAAVDAKRDVGRWSESMSLNRDALVETLPGGDTAVVLAMSSCQQWNEWLEDTANRQLQLAATGDQNVGDLIDLDSLKGAALMLSGRPGLSAKRIAEQFHLQLRVENAIESIESIKTFFDLVAPILEDHPGYRLSIEETTFRQKKALLATIKVWLDESSPREYLISIWPLEDDTLIVQGGGLSALNAVVKRIRSGERMTQDVAFRNSLELAAPESQHLLMVDLHNSCQLCSQIYLAANEKDHVDHLMILLAVSRMFSKMKGVPPLLIAGQFEADHVGARVTATELLLAKVSQQIPLDFVASTFLKVVRGESIKLDQLSLMHLESPLKLGIRNPDGKPNASGRSVGNARRGALRIPGIDGDYGALPFFLTLKFFGIFM